MSDLAHWLRNNQALVILLVGQAIVGGIYMVNLEARVSTLEVRGSPHLNVIDNRLTVLESLTKENKERLEKVTDVMTRKLNINP
jgi:Tfp pilus assembly protein PilO